MTAFRGFESLILRKMFNEQCSLIPSPMSKSKNNYSIVQFRKDYPDDRACLDKLLELKVGKNSCCKSCGHQTTYRPISTRKCYQCPRCYYQLYPCEGTIFENTKLPLIYWFYAIYLFTVSKNGISGYELQRQLNVTYKTAWRMLKQIRILCGKDNVLFEDGTFELDETFVGGKNKNRHKDKKVAYSQGRSFKDKTPVFGIYNRETLKVKTFVIPDTKRRTIQPLIKTHIPKQSYVMTDEWSAYYGLNCSYNHGVVDHGRKEYQRGEITTNRIENYWSVFKRTINGSYIHVSRKYLQNYADEVAFRFNYRLSNRPVFDRLLELVSLKPVLSSS